MTERAIALLIVALPLLAGSPASAVTTLTATLTNAQENPPAVPTTVPGDPRPASFGEATFVLSDDQMSLTFTATVFNIDFTGAQTTDPNDDLTVAHIHAGPTVTPTTNGGVVWGFFGAPFNDDDPNDQVVTPFTTGVGGTISGKWDAPEGNNTTLADQIANLLEGRAYINFHTTQFGGGEVRGAIVPEPSTALLLGLGIAGLAGLRRPRGAA
jgi:hypothetical protein